MLNIYNNTGDKLTIGYYELSQGHNWLDKTMWADISKSQEAQALIKECKILVDSYDDYRVYSSLVDTLFGKINDPITDDQTADYLTSELEKTEEQWEELELLADDFVGDIRLGQQLKFIKDNIQAYKDKLAQAIADRG